MSDGILPASAFGIVNSPTLDQTSLLQAFINVEPNAAYGASLLKVIDIPVIKITSPLTFPPGGTKVIGTGSGGDFASYIIAENCACLTINQVHHVELSNIMFWPQGTTPPQDFIHIEGSYSIRLRDIRIHQSSPGSYLPSVAVVNIKKTTGGVKSQDVILDRLMIRIDNVGAFHPVGYNFGPDCGQIDLLHPDTERCQVAFKHLGGKVCILGGYSEIINTNGISLEPSTDANASLTMLGGSIGMAGVGGVPIAIRNGTKNTRILGTTTSDLGAYHAFVYGLTGSSNIHIDLANGNNTKLGSNFTPTSPSVITWGRGLNSLPATKHTTINVTAGTLSVGDLTGAGSMVVLTSTNAAPGTQTTRTASQMIADHGLGELDASYLLRIANTGSGTFAMAAGAGVTLTGTMTVLQNTYREFVVTFNGNAQTCTIQTIGTGTYS